MSKGSIFVVGSLHYDIVVNAPHLPTCDETVMGDDVKFVCGGKGGNQAVAASQHGADVSFAGAVGKDFFADALLEHLGNAGVDTRQISKSGSTASGMSVAIVEANGDYGAVVASGANQHINATDFEIPDGTAWVILQNEIPEAINISVAQNAKRKGTPVLLNAAPMRRLSPALLESVDILIVNRVEARELFGQSIDSPKDALAALNNYNHTFRCIVITLGAEGLVFCEQGTLPRYIPAQAVKTVSSHGAGDTFVGAMCSRLVDGQSLEGSLVYANAAAATLISTAIEDRLKIRPPDVTKHF